VLTRPQLQKRPGQPLGARLGVSFETGRRRRNWRPAILADLAHGCGRLVLSEENILGQLTGTGGLFEVTLYPEAAQRVATIGASAAPVPLTLALTVRNPVDYLVSAYSQSLFRGHGGPVEAFVGRLPLLAIDWCDLAGRLLAVPRVEEIVIWRFEDYPQVAVAAADAIAGTQAADSSWFAHPPLHRGLSVRAVAAALEAPEGPERAAAAEAARARYPVGPGNPRLRPYDDEDEALSAEFYDDQWRRMGDMPGLRRLQP